MGRPGSAFVSAPRSQRAADVFLPDRLVVKLKRFWRHKKRRGEGLEPADPLFCNQSRRRISKRRVQFATREWQRKAGFDRLYPFHSLRHSGTTAVYSATHDLFLAQRFARRASPLTTVVHTHPSDEERFARSLRLPLPRLRGVTLARLRRLPGSVKRHERLEAFRLV